MNRRAHILRAIATILILAIAVFAVPGIRAAQVVAPKGVPIQLDVSKGLIIRLERPCSSVFVADPDIADVQLKSPTVLYLMGKAAGETTAYAVDQNDAVLLDSRVDVRQDIDRLQREISQIDPSRHRWLTIVKSVCASRIERFASGQNARREGGGYR